MTGRVEIWYQEDGYRQISSLLYRIKQPTFTDVWDNKWIKYYRYSLMGRDDSCHVTETSKQSKLVLNVMLATEQQRQSLRMEKCLQQMTNTLASRVSSTR